MQVAKVPIGIGQWPTPTRVQQISLQGTTTKAGS
jgi:hypothetical protein